ncbi:unnamed protein product [Eruca vesicaria subsp. sativa]|uniref:Uncharacterized protein n=1 Tax=Eruca vesicaria subsp. sativa TaxID=29727 RepID=A0ABC8JCH0_ERUVS|nr:unnamed protein product [Eruca vesicaria subsp. sativa]
MKQSCSSSFRHPTPSRPSLLRSAPRPQTLASEVPIPNLRCRHCSRHRCLKFRTTTNYPSLMSEGTVIPFNISINTKNQFH